MLHQNELIEGARCSSVGYRENMKPPKKYKKKGGHDETGSHKIIFATLKNRDATTEELARLINRTTSQTYSIMVNAFIRTGSQIFQVDEFTNNGKEPAVWGWLCRHL